MRKSDYIFFTLIFILLIGIGYLVHLIKSETAQCVKNPYIYGASKMGNVECSCIQNNNALCPAKFSFNDSTFESVVNRCGTERSYPSIDFSKLNLSAG